MEKYELVKDIGFGNFGVARLMRNKATKELVAMKYIERGHKLVLIPTHLAIVMEYAAEAGLFECICNARYFFQQLISGVNYCHCMQICHRDLKLENTLLDGRPAPRLKICDFEYSKSSLLHLRPKSTVDTPVYIAPEVLSRREYDGKRAFSINMFMDEIDSIGSGDGNDDSELQRTMLELLNQLWIADSGTSLLST